MLPVGCDEDLRLVLQAAKGARMDDSVAVALKRRAHLVLGLRVEATATVFRVRRIGRTRNRPNHARPYARPERASSAALTRLRAPRSATLSRGAGEGPSGRRMEHLSRIAGEGGA